MRVVFLGNAPWSVPSLQALAASSHEVVLVITRAPRAAGRGNRPTPTPVAEAARRLRLPVNEVETVKSGPGFDALADAEPAVLAVVAYGEILPKSVLDIPRVAPVNVHFSLLPELRGAAPVQRAILGGLEVTGVTTIRMDEGMDTGPILLQAEEAISPHDDAGSLGDRLAALGGRLLMETVDRLEAGSLVDRRQDEAKATYAPKLKPADSIVRRVRALAPEPGATTSFRGKNLKLLAAREAPMPDRSVDPRPREAGQLVPGAKELGVGTGDGLLILEVVQPEGRRRMSGAEFVRGYRPEISERLG